MAKLYLVSVNQMLKTISESISYKTNNFIAGHLIEGIKQSGNNVNIPSNSYICDNLAEYREALLRLYDGTLGLIDGVNDIPEHIKLAQAALLDTIHFGYNVYTGEHALYTMNLGMFEGNKDSLPDKTLNAIMAKNKLGEAKAFRVDVEYVYETGDMGEIDCKLVENKKVKIDEDSVVLVPFISIYNIMEMLKKYLSSKCVLKVVQDIGSTRKVRCITLDEAQVLKYSPNMPVEALVPQYFSWGGFMYAPVLGAPETTAGVTKVDMFCLEEIKRVTTAKDIQALGVRHIKNPIQDMVRENAIINAIMFLSSQYPEKFYHVYDGLPRRDEILQGVEPDEFTQSKVSMYLHSLKAGELKKVLSLLPSAKKQIVDTESILVQNKDMGAVTGSELIGLLKTSVCRILMRKKDFGLTTAICTNNPDILKAIYGDDYFKYYESFNARLGRALELVEEKSVAVLHALSEYGFDDIDPQDFYERLVGLQGNADINVDSYRQVVYDIYGKKQRKAAETSTILVRCIDAYISKSGVEGYYRYVDPNKIINVKVLS